MKRILDFRLLILILLPGLSLAQYKSTLTAQQWTDSVFNSLNDSERIAQLMIIRAHSNLGPDHVAKVVNDIQKYNVGGLCFFQGGPVRQANLTNYYQSIAKTPLMITIDAEYGLAMRLDSVTKYPYQLTLGAMEDQNLVYRMGLAVGEQCKRIGVHVNYAPVVDINNNPNNPVIGYRSFGEDKNKVAAFGVAYMKGMQDAGIMACAKHFPGHGDVDVDSHLDLPVINKSMKQLDSLELVPFRALFNAGVGSVMTAHLSVPAIDNTANRATSISKKNVTDLLRNKLNFHGLSFTDALEMKAVAKYFPGGTIAVESLIAGNDMLCLPASVPEAIDAILKAIDDKKLSWDDINSKVKKVLLAKYALGLNQWKPVDTNNLLSDLNAKTDSIRYEVAKKTITVLKNESLSVSGFTGKKIAYVGIGTSVLNDFGKRLQDDLGAKTFIFSYFDKDTDATAILKEISQGNYDAVITGISDFSIKPNNNYNISPAAISLWKGLQSVPSANYTLVFGNVLATQNFCTAKNLVACYQDDNITQQAAADLMEGKIFAEGRLPVRVCNVKFGFGIVVNKPLSSALAFDKFNAVDSIVNDAIAQKAFPGCVVFASHKGKIVYEKAFGHYEYSPSPAMTIESVFDLASVTKISATTLAVMKLYEQGKLNIKKKLSTYLPWVKGTNKANLVIENILLHQAGLVPFIQFYKETIDTKTSQPLPAYYSQTPAPGFSIRVAENLYLRNDWKDSMFNRILKSPLGPRNKYVYSDNDFIFLGKVVEQITKMPLDQYVDKEFYDKIGLTTTSFKPRSRGFPLDMIVPTDDDKYFRYQLIHGDVNDEGASMFGGVAGHAGLFSDACDLSLLYQMLLNGGELFGRRYLKPETIDLFTSYHSSISRRGYGFDKPEKDNAIRRDPYPSSLASPQTYGHTGFTGTCVWVDPKYGIVYIFLSNRVYPTRDNNKLSHMMIRGKIQDAIYRALGI
ncbi:MAG: glycoside hydrolase family 3 N-terminal domain-containing protein [Bacteroidota bacterium]